MSGQDSGPAREGSFGSTVGCEQSRTQGASGNHAGAELDFPTAFDWYQKVVCDAADVADGVAKLIANAGADRILDCAAGSGLPALQLRQQGLRIDCSDGSEAMVAQFRRNAKRLGVDDQCAVVDWADLDPGNGPYDYLICRGNSFVYASSWEGGSDVAETAKLCSYLASFAAMLRPGGCLQIDAPAALSSGPFDERITEWTDSGTAIRVSEEVTEVDGSRYWTCTVSVTHSNGEPQSLTFDLHSSKLTVHELIGLLKQSGFVDCEIAGVDGDRSNHATVLARTRTQPSSISDQ